jgi:hypothetical protein
VSCIKPIISSQIFEENSFEEVKVGPYPRFWSFFHPIGLPNQLIKLYDLALFKDFLLIFWAPYQLMTVMKLVLNISLCRSKNVHTF